MRNILTALTAIAVLSFIVGIVFFVTSNGSSGSTQIILPQATRVPVVELKVYITGAVENPGVYTVKDGDRLNNLIEAAGGALPDADLTTVNLAARVDDEDHWHIPTVREPVSTPNAQAPAPQPLAPQLVVPSVSTDANPAPLSGKINTNAAATSGKIDINSADEALLQSLPGIGEVKSQAIVRYRESNGPFSTVEDLLDVSGIGPATLDSVMDLIEAR